MLGQYMSLLLLFQGGAYAQCKTFEAQGKPIYPKLAIEEGYYSSPPFGVPIYKQIQQVTPGLVCNDPSTFHKTHPLSKKPKDFSCERSVFDEKHCGFPARGNAYAEAMTNLSYATAADEKANDRIAALALKQVTWPQPNSRGHWYWTTGKRFKIPYSGYLICLKRGQSGWLDFIPTFACVAGVLKDCSGDNSKFEQNGQGVAVCMPYSAGPEEIVGIYQPNYTRAALARAHSSNPAESEPAPSLAISHHSVPWLPATLGLAIASIFLTM